MTGISQPDLSRLLLRAILLLGSDIEIRVKKPAKNRPGKARVMSKAFA